MAAAVIALAPAAASAADLPGIQAAGSLRVIVAADEDKATFDPRGGASPGFERELVDTFARVHGLRLEPVGAQRSTSISPTCAARPRGTCCS